MTQLHQLTQAMITYDGGSPKRIQHFLKVHSFAKLIGEEEHLNEQELFILETAALVHDIGILPAMRKYGSSEGKLQEKEGVVPAKEMISSLAFAQEVIDRVCYLVAHHHTYDQVDGPDYRILLEADALVNLYEDQVPLSAVEASLDRVFRTKSGTDICQRMFFS